MIVTGSGHRCSYFPGKYDEKHPWAVDLKERLSNWIFENKPSLIISGMALGYDTFLAEEAVRQKIPFDAYVPFPSQSSNWPQSSKARYLNLLGYARETIVTSDKYSNAAFLERDCQMVDACDLILALLDPKVSKGGTYHTVSYARKKNKEVINLWKD